VELESGNSEPTGSPNNSSLFVGTPVSPTEELEWTSTELRNSLRSIEWDLEDLDESISIVEKNPRKFKITSAELSARRSFISTTKEEVLVRRFDIFEPQNLPNSNSFPISKEQFVE